MSAGKGHPGWQKIVSYGKRSLDEMEILLYKKRIGRSLHARTLRTEKAEVACKIVNMMIDLGTPVSGRIV